MVALLKLQEKSLHLRSRGWKKWKFSDTDILLSKYPILRSKYSYFKFFYTENTARWLKLNIFWGWNIMFCDWDYFWANPRIFWDWGLNSRIFLCSRVYITPLPHITKWTQCAWGHLLLLWCVYNKLIMLSPQYCSLAHTEIWNVNIAVNRLPIAIS